MHAALLTDRQLPHCRNRLDRQYTHNQGENARTLPFYSTHQHPAKEVAQFRDW